MKKELSVHQKLVLSAFKRRGRDYFIEEVYMVVYGGRTIMSSRSMQQRLAPVFANINKKLKALSKGKIIPGKLKRTYRYSTKG